jgi:hypothetical protein
MYVSLNPLQHSQADLGRSALKSLYPGIAVAGGSEIEKNDNVLDRKKLRAELGYGYLRV